MTAFRLCLLLVVCCAAFGMLDLLRFHKGN